MYINILKKQKRQLNKIIIFEVTKSCHRAKKYIHKTKKYVVLSVQS